MHNIIVRRRVLFTIIIVACLLSACAKEEKTVADDVSVEEVNIDDESATLYDAFLQGSAKETVENSDDATGKNGNLSLSVFSSTLFSFCPIYRI